MIFSRSCTISPRWKDFGNMERERGRKRSEVFDLEMEDPIANRTVLLPGIRLSCSQRAVLCSANGVAPSISSLRICKTLPRGYHARKSFLNQRRTSFSPSLKRWLFVAHFSIIMGSIKLINFSINRRIDLFSFSLSFFLFKLAKRIHSSFLRISWTQYSSYEFSTEKKAIVHRVDETPSH